MYAVSYPAVAPYLNIVLQTLSYKFANISKESGNPPEAIMTDPLRMYGIIGRIEYSVLGTCVMSMKSVQTESNSRSWTKLVGL
jgi:hypothetical protein